MTNWRWRIAGLLFLATVINYIDRQTLSVIASVISKELHLTNTEYSNILTAFLVPYTAMYIVSGWLVDRWGTRISLAVFMSWWSAANALHAFARGALSLGAFRFLLGMGESGNFMAAEKVISEWFPPRERAFANGLVNAAASTGAICAPPLIAWITVQFGWQMAFVATGLFGFVWLAAWLAWFETPERHKSIGAEELALIQHDRITRDAERVSYRELLRSTQTWGLLFARVLADPVWWFYLFWLPKYLQDIRHFSLLQVGMFAWMPYLAADFGAITGGWFSGWLIRRGMPTLKARRVAMIPSAAMMPVGILVAYLPATPAMAVICVSAFCHMGWKTNLMTMTNDVFPLRIVGTAAGVVGLGSGLGGALSTPLVGRIVDHFSYDAVFWVMAVLHPLATMLIFATVKRDLAESSS